MKIIIQLNEKEIIQKEYAEVKEITEIVSELGNLLPYQVFAARVDGELVRLTDHVEKDCKLDLLDLRSFEGNMIYQSSLILLYMKAVHDTVGKNTPIEIHNSLSKGLFTTIRTNGIDDEIINKIESRMRELVEQKLPITEQKVTRRQMIEIADKAGRKDQVKLVKSAPDLRNALLFSLGDESEVYNETLVPDTSYLRWFELRRYKNGVLLRFPHQSNPDVVPEYEEQKLLYAAFSEATRWDRLMGVNYASDLNELILNNNYQDLVLLSEALHEKKIAEIATQIYETKKRIILIAGPSSSGKTTFAKRLCIQLRVTGLKPLYLGTDDYFVEREQNPVDENGKKDFEGLNALDHDLFNQQMNDLLNGKKVDLPEYSFIEGRKIFGKRITSIDSSQPIVIEGLHCLNPKLTEYIPDDQKFKIYISPLTQLNIDAHNRIPTTDSRMLRRMVRDAQFRGINAKKTISTWSSVRRGEDRNIFPFNAEADVFFNSNSLYEIAVLKKYAEPQLKRITEDEAEYAEAQRMLRFLSFFVAMDDDSIIPNNSILREFIGGSVIVH